jgi:proteasome lid subunit RPN8/RPN11
VAEPSIPSDAVPVVIEDAARQQVGAHVGEDTTVELGGVLAGWVDGTIVTVVAAVPARAAVGTARSFSFTQEAWDEVNRALGQEHPDLVPVGWYHSHPGLGIHLSDYDRFICSTFFPEPWQVAYVVDPVGQESGLFVRGGQDLVVSTPVSEPPLVPTRTAGADRRVLVAGAALVAVLLFVAGFLVHSSSPASKVTFTTAYDSGALALDVTVTEHNGVADLTERFREADTKKTLIGTVDDCVPSGVVLGSYKNLEIVAPNDCLLDLTPSHSTATITASGPPSTVLASLGPANFRPFNPPAKKK